MIERREDASLAFEAREPVRVAGEQRRQNLNRNVAAETAVAGAIDLAL
jgi:hypothetical protein